MEQQVGCGWYPIGRQLAESAMAGENEHVIKTLSKCNYTSSVFMVHIFTMSTDFEKVDF